MPFQNDAPPAGELKVSFGSWSDETLGGYVVMMESFVSSSVSVEARERYQTKLDEACREISNRLSECQGVSTVQTHSDLVMQEEQRNNYEHERTEHSDTHDTEDGD